MLIGQKWRKLSYTIWQDNQNCLLRMEAKSIWLLSVSFLHILVTKLYMYKFIFCRNVKGKNGLNCFFSEETYSRFLPKDTFESRLEESLKKVGIHLPPILENSQLDNTKSEPDEEWQREDDYNQSCDMSHDVQDRKDADYSVSANKRDNNESTREDLKDEDIRKDVSSSATTTKPSLATCVQKSGGILSGKEAKSNANTTPNLMLVETREPPEIVHEEIKTIEKSVKNELDTETKKSSEHLSQVHSEKLDISKTSRAGEQTVLPSSSNKDDTGAVVDKRKRDPSSIEKDPTICRGQDDSKDERTMRQKYYDCNPKRESTHLRDRIKLVT